MAANAHVIESRHSLDPHTIRRLAVEAARDPRTVQAVARGGGSPMARAAVMAAAGRLGIDLAACADGDA